MAVRRPDLPSKIETEVLVRSRRRCCLCFGLNFDTAYKRIQIAHLDGNRENNKVDNLAALCQPHHDEYDSIPSQTKKLTPKEAKHHRQQLYDALEQKNEQLVLSFTKAGDNQGVETATPSAQLLGKVLAAYDAETDRQASGGHINGIALSHLANVAINEYGDFDVANEALVSLLRLGAAKNKKWPVFLWPHVPSATPSFSAVEILHRIHKHDFWAFSSALMRLSDVAMKNEEVDVRTEIPADQSFEALATLPTAIFESLSRTLYLCFRPNAPVFAEWTTFRLLGTWKALTLRAALAMAAHNIFLPNVPLWKWIQEQMNEGRNMNTWFHNPGNLKSDILLAICCQRIARLPEPCFQKIIDMKYEMRISDYPQRIDAPSIPDNLTKLRRLGLRSYGTSGIIEVRPAEAIEAEAKCRELVDEINRFGTQVVDGIREKIIAERKEYLSLDEDERSYIETF